MYYKPINKAAHIKNFKLFSKLFVFTYVFAFVKNIDFCPTKLILIIKIMYSIIKCTGHKKNIYTYVYICLYIYIYIYFNPTL